MLGKQFTAAAALVLAGDGVLSLSDPVAQRLPGGPAAWAGITAHHLLTHTSGLPHGDAATGPSRDRACRCPARTPQPA
ncbi:serine hydrolase domain-containing protein [Streptomyces sp. NPDC001985]|uniref:serine hydrolase domain-containing protein n=1 Tax=Streptomyces sp. NPDC001985 TaxID=3154406 RepID=UPI003319E025